MPRTTKPSQNLLATLSKISVEIDASNDTYCYYPYTRSVEHLERRGLIRTLPNRLGGPDPRILLTPAGRDALGGSQ